jgi:hypothetical protein
MNMISNVSCPVTLVAVAVVVLFWYAIHDDAWTNRLNTLLTTMLALVVTYWLASRERRQQPERREGPPDSDDPTSS